MNAYKIDHIGVAVASIDDALAIYRALGLEEKHREEVPSQKVLTAFLPAGESRIELLQPTSEDSPVARFLAKRGQGIHHICFGVRDIEASVAELQRRGFRLINSRPAPGAEGKKIVFLHPDSGNGVLIELSQEAGAAAP
jgi:methylmalonyl-CoA/ethylmalonyl-CoA epimerase